MFWFLYTVPVFEFLKVWIYFFLACWRCSYFHFCEESFTLHTVRSLILYTTHWVVCSVCFDVCVPCWLLQAQQSLNFIHSKISLKAAGDNAVIGNSAVSPEVVCISCSPSFVGQLSCGCFEEQTCARPVFGSKLCFHVWAGADSGIKCFLLTPYVA